MGKAVVIIWCGLLAGFVGYEAGTYLACVALEARGNLCNVAGAFGAGPLGWAAGGAVGVRLVRRHGAGWLTVAALAGCTLLVAVAAVALSRV